MKSDDTFHFWLSQTQRYPVLCKSEMLRLARIIQDDTLSEAKRIKARQKLISHNLRLIPKAARIVISKKRNSKYGDQTTLDYFQAGVLGLNRAAEKFDPTRGYTFSTYAQSWIMHFIQREADKHHSSIYVPRDTLCEMYQSKEEFESLNHVSIKDRKKNRLVDAYFALNCTSLDASANLLAEKESSYKNLFSHQCMGVYDPEVTDDNYNLEEIIKTLPNEEWKQVLRMRFYENKGHDEISNKLGITKSKLRYIIGASYKRLRKNNALKQYIQLD